MSPGGLCPPDPLEFIAFRAIAEKKKARAEPWWPCPAYATRCGARVALQRCPILRTGDQIIPWKCCLKIMTHCSALTIGRCQYYSTAATGLGALTDLVREKKMSHNSWLPQKWSRGERVNSGEHKRVTFSERRGPILILIYQLEQSPCTYIHHKISINPEGKEWYTCSDFQYQVSLVLQVLELLFLICLSFPLFPFLSSVSNLYSIRIKSPKELV